MQTKPKPLKPKRLRISVKKQQLTVKAGRRTLRKYRVSTSAFGKGLKKGVKKTPLGRFEIAEMIGDGAPLGTVFKSRKPVGLMSEQPAGEDLVVSRILWLGGLEAHNANTYDRFIYIHGTNHEDKLGELASHGCVRMRNADVVELFGLVEVGTRIQIDA